MSKRWIYHETENAKIIEDADFAKWNEEGWQDTPAAFLKLANAGIDQKKTDAGDYEETEKAQQLLDSVHGIADCLNGMMNLEEMSKKELIDFAKRHFKTELKKSKSKPSMIKKIKELDEA